MFLLHENKGTLFVVAWKVVKLIKLKLHFLIKLHSAQYVFCQKLEMLRQTIVVFLLAVSGKHI